jgi:hypothetical protein
VRLGELQRINCGSTECKTDADSSRADYEPAVRAWYASETGNAATNLLAGEMRDATGSPTILFGFSYMEAFDAAGIAVEIRAVTVGDREARDGRGASQRGRR